MRGKVVAGAEVFIAVGVVAVVPDQARARFHKPARCALGGPPAQIDARTQGGHAAALGYSAKSVENVPADLKKKYFTQVEGSYKISDDIKRCVTFKEHNLLKDSYPKDYDLILCRNVVIYFTDDAKDMIYKNFFNTLKSKGILFIGSTEQITTYRELGFERLSSFYFRKP